MVNHPKFVKSYERNMNNMNNIAKKYELTLISEVNFCELYKFLSKQNSLNLSPHREIK